MSWTQDFTTQEEFESDVKFALDEGKEFKDIKVDVNKLEKRPMERTYETSQSWVCPQEAESQKESFYFARKRSHSRKRSKQRLEKQNANKQKNKYCLLCKKRIKMKDQDRVSVRCDCAFDNPSDIKPLYRFHLSCCENPKSRDELIICSCNFLFVNPRNVLKDYLKINKLL